MMRKLVKILGGLVVLYAVISDALFAAMLQSPDDFARTMKHVPWPAFMVLPFNTFDNVTERAYTGWPDRFYVIDQDGRVSYKSSPALWFSSPGCCGSSAKTGSGHETLRFVHPS